MPLALMQAAQEAVEEAAGAGAAGAGAAGAGAAGAAAQDDGGLVLHMLPMTVLGVATVVSNLLKHTLPLVLLGDTLYWTLTKQQGGQQQIAANASPNKKGRKASKAAAAAAATAAGPSARLSYAYLSTALLDRLEFTEEFDLLLRVCIMMVLNACGTALMRHFLLPGFPVHSSALFITGIFTLVWLLYKVEWEHQLVGRQEKAIMSVVGLLGAAACLVLLVLLQPRPLPFNPEAATLELSQRVAAVARQRLRVPEEELQPFDNPRGLVLLLSVIGGALAGMLLSPGVRYGRILQSLSDPPAWATFAKPRPLAKAVVQAGFTLQLLLTPLFVNSATDVLPLPEPALPYVRGLAMLLVAVLQLAAVPTLLQAFLHTTALHAHVVCNHPGVNDAQRVASVRETATATLSQTAKVATQMSVVPALLLVCSLWHLLMSLPSPLAAVKAQQQAPPSVAQLDTQPSEMVLCFTGFLGWWVSGIYMLWACLGLALTRLSSLSLGD